MEKEIIIKIENLSKEYRLGMIGGTTFRDEMQRLGAKLWKKEDPTLAIGERNRREKRTFLALKDISLNIHKGEAVGIIGHNGAGKSTLLKLLCRVTAPTHGTISYNGRIASMLEVGTGFHQELTGRENIYMNGAILGMSKKEIDSKMEEIIEFSECGPFIDTPVKRYSSGMYVKLAFAVAAHLDADIMIMDEVLAVGDMKFQQKCLRKMRSAASEDGKTVLYVSHNMSTIAQLCDRCVVLNHGQIIFEGSVSEGIQIYMDNGSKGETRKVYREYQRPKWIEDDIRTEEISFCDRTSNIFVDSERIKMKVVWKNQKNIENLCIRWEIRHCEGNPVGASFLEYFYSGKAGEKGEVILSYHFPELMPGSYDSVLVFYYQDDVGSRVILDHVPGLSFDKKLVENNITKANWNQKVWGSIQFQIPEIEKSGRK